MDIENDPVPYMMLFSGAAYPRTFNKQDEVIMMIAEHDLKSLDSVKLKESFISEFDNGVYRFTDSKHGEHPHFAQAFYDENEGILLFSSMTKFVFQALIKNFNRHGYAFPVLP